MKRRDFINFFVGGSVIGTIAAFLYPVIRYVIPPKQAQVGLKSVVAAKVGELAPNSFKIFKFGNSPGILINTEEGDLKAFSAVCTHLTCNVIYVPEAESMLCPCHNGRFDLNGNVISGPPPSPLESYKVEINRDEIVVAKAS